MITTQELKRQNFNVTPEQEAELLTLQSEFASPSVKDAIFKAVRLALFLRHEVKRGNRLGLKDRHGNVTDIIMPEWESANALPWTYLVERPYSWKKQLFVKGHKLTAAQVWLDMKANHMSKTEAAENWALPVEVIVEIENYCEQNTALLQMEADEEKLFLSQQGVRLSA